MATPSLSLSIIELLESPPSGTETSASVSASTTNACKPYVSETQTIAQASDWGIAGSHASLHLLPDVVKGILINCVKLNDSLINYGYQAKQNIVPAIDDSDAYEK